MPKISVIIPVHNSQDYLPICLDSLLNQSFTDFEVLLMENFSTDNTYQVAENYVKKDNRIKLFKLDKKGLCNARNEGIIKATGDYIVFMDNDDIVSSNHLDSLYACVDNTQCNMGIAPFAQYYSETKIKHKKYKFNPGIYNKNDKGILLTERVCWSRIYSRELINKYNVTFKDDAQNVEDFPFYAEMLLVSDNVMVTDKSCYFYRQGRKGQASRGTTLSSLKKNFLAMELVENLLKKYNKYDIYKDYYNYEFVKEIIGKTFGASPLKKLNKKELNEILSPIKNKILNINLNKNISEIWVVKQFKYFKYFYGNNNLRLYFKIIRFYKNFILKPLGIKYEK